MHKILKIKCICFTQYASKKKSLKSEKSNAVKQSMLLFMVHMWLCEYKKPYSSDA